MIEQFAFPAKAGSVWNPGHVDRHGYFPPSRKKAVLADMPETRPLVTVIGTVRNEAVPWSRSWHWWARQTLPPWLAGRVEYLVLDDGSSDDIADRVQAARDEGHPVKYVRLREAGSPERSCTLAFNYAIKNLVTSPLVLIQWWDRIPGSRRVLQCLVEPFRFKAGIVTTGFSRHIGGSSSMVEMSPEELEANLAKVPWQSDPDWLASLCGPIGSHTKPGRMTESSAFCIPVQEFVALGGYDERYTARHGYPNVEMWRRILQSGLVALNPPADLVVNYHQSHGQPRSEKTLGWLGDCKLRRNMGEEWGREAGCQLSPSSR